MCPRTSKLDCEGDTREALVILIKSHTRRPPRPGRDRRKIRTHRSYMCTVDVRLDRRTFALFHTRVFNFTLLRVFLSYVPQPARCVGHAVPCHGEHGVCQHNAYVRTVRSYKGPQRGTVEAISVYTKSRRVYLGEGRAHGFTARPVINTNYLKPRSHRG